MRADHGRIRLADAQNPHPTMNERCAQAITDTGSPRPTLTDQCAQATSNTVYPGPMSHVRCFFHWPTFIAKNKRLG